MPQCFRCGRTVNATDVKCKTCGAELKAFGHPGIELHRATGEVALCVTCTYHVDDSCNYDKRPHAQDCTLYQDVKHQIAEIHRPGARQPRSSNQLVITVAVVLGLLLLASMMR
ncbi:hypothetical protein IQ266_09530 [filamentous cyanobacterium LEGE 11480]|uniref:DZANK-type domain-containing protein n=1 Tax=Romeriopsis navalis LEGE 11480 TaxID=2777977 RepID=A0A928VNI6_9CYAN|nr:hypothetical protein [Romeriopsis navalis]MBE9029966.1 hypothetical protein [Romeriopsis navalis LEGE 11480]